MIYIKLMETFYNEKNPNKIFADLVFMNIRNSINKNLFMNDWDIIIV